MIESLSSPIQALLGTLLTWGLTALGASIVFFLPNADRSVLDGSLGFAGGVMTAASFWSLLAPAIDMATESGSYGSKGEFAFVPIACGFLLGTLFVYGADVLMTKFNVHSVQESLDLYTCDNKKDDDASKNESYRNILFDNDIMINKKHGNTTRAAVAIDLSSVKQRKPGKTDQCDATLSSSKPYAVSYQQWKRILLLIVAITVHNIPEGLAVGVGFGAIGKTPVATFNKAKNLALGIGIQNFPEGMAVSLPLRGAGYSLLSAFWWGQLSGMVEPLAGVLGAVAVGICEPLLPYALSFAAGAMIFVVVDDIIPEAQTGGNGRLASFWCIGGFITMMVLDVALGY